MKNSMKGFTLAELLIVIVILGILGGIALPRFYPQQEKGRVAEAVAILSAIRQGEEAYRLEKGNYIDLDSTDNWAVIGMEDPNDSANKLFTYSVDASGTATATRINATADYLNKTIILKIDGTWDQAATHPFKPSN